MNDDTTKDKRLYRILTPSDREEIMIADDAVTFLNCLTELINNKELSKKLSVNGREFVRNNINFDRELKAINAVIDNI